MSEQDSSPADPSASDPPARGSRLTRRGFLLGALGAAAGASLYARSRREDPTEPPILRQLGDEGGQRASVFVAKADRYDEALADRMLEGLRELGLDRKQVQGRRVLLKPNLVETTPENPHINTNPTLLVALAEAFRRLDAAEVAVAEGQGHRRDSWLVLEEAGYIEQFEQAGLNYTDLNHDALITVPNGGKLMGMPKLVFPKTLEWADIFVSVAKLKTHHWVGATLSLKNLFGIMPGIYYGWPKNVLHHAGIGRSIVDINLTVRRLPGIQTHISVVDGVIGLEGDGPINGDPKQVGAVLMGLAPAAVDATAARIMNLRVDLIGTTANNPDPGYLVNASRLGLGPIRTRHVEQRGASLSEVQSDFKVMQNVPWLEILKSPV